MNLPLFIAKRYLIAKKSHNVINVISAISAIGMAIGTAALIIIMSIYNGFDSLIKSMMGNVEADFVIEPAKGKAFVPEGTVYDWIYEQDIVESMCCVLQEQVFISYDGKQGLAVAKGVDNIYESETPLREHIRDGEFKLYKGSIPLAVAGAELAYKMGMNPRFLAPVELYFPSRTRKFSVSNPAASIESVKVWPSGIFSVSSDIDASLMIVPIDIMRELLEYENEVSAVEIRLCDDVSKYKSSVFHKELAKRIGPDFKVKDRYQQNESLYKMMKYEKAAIYMILIFIIIIIAFNIFGSLSMLIIDKRDDTQTLRCLGAGEKLIRKIFVLEGWMISLAGLSGGLIIGIGFSLAQQYLGFIKMPGNFVIQAYPVILSWQDILFTAAGVAAIGYIIALLPVVTFLKKNTGTGKI